MEGMRALCADVCFGRRYLSIQEVVLFSLLLRMPPLYRARVQRRLPTVSRTDNPPAPVTYVPGERRSLINVVGRKAEKQDLAHRAQVRPRVYKRYVLFRRG